VWCRPVAFGQPFWFGKNDVPRGAQLDLSVRRSIDLDLASAEPRKRLSEKAKRCFVKGESSRQGEVMPWWLLPGPQREARLPPKSNHFHRGDLQKHTCLVGQHTCRTYRAPGSQLECAGVPSQNTVVKYRGCRQKARQKHWPPFSKQPYKTDASAINTPYITLPKTNILTSRINKAPTREGEREEEDARCGH
jgi:hypothetical protein